MLLRDFVDKIIDVERCILIAMPNEKDANWTAHTALPSCLWMHYEQLPQAPVDTVSHLKEPHHGIVSPNKPFLLSVFSGILPQRQEM